MDFEGRTKKHKTDWFFYVYHIAESSGIDIAKVWQLNSIW